ncbi:hypothetical protein ZIOFF_022727 [Zingiber officinale]|uniref:Uncharacterized protein n=1 Tax=Zingiber officinale TaxID=94328 RepID=A0A8J5HLQ7_ZINOF|nr:hypothetical protein ZIOFF_022727 [Zingiber officinale]
MLLSVDSAARISPAWSISPTSSAAALSKACKVKARGKFDIPFLEEQDENVSPIAYQEEEISRPHLVLTDTDIDDDYIICDVDEEELNSMEIEELRSVMNGKQIVNYCRLLLYATVLLLHSATAIVLLVIALLVLLFYWLCTTSVLLLLVFYCIGVLLLKFCNCSGDLITAWMSNRGTKDIASNKGRSRGRGRHRYQSLRIQDEQLDTMPELDNIPNEVQEEVERQISENDVINDARYEEEQYRERQNVDGHSTNPSFNLQSWCDVVGCQYKGRVYGFGRNQHFRRSYNESSNEMCSNEKNKELSQEIEDMRTTSKRMENEIIESKNKLELVITENRQREEKLIEEGRQREEKLMEEGRQREENLKEMVRKMIQEVYKSFVSRRIWSP